MAVAVGYAPFMLIGVLNVVVVLFAIIVRIKSPGDMPTARGNSAPVGMH